jgi:site-specific recombinase XerD
MANTPRPPGLIQRYREELQARHYAKRTVATYEQWLRRFLRFHGRRHPREMGSGEVNAFLTHLAVELKVSPSTQNQALSAAAVSVSRVAGTGSGSGWAGEGENKTALAGGDDR